MKKEFAPYELALRLNKLGFDEPCFGTWDRPDKLWLGIVNGSLDIPEDIILSPTFSKAFRWLRENYEYEYQITRIVTGSYHALIQSNTDEYLDNLRELVPGICLDEVVDVYTYDDAELECLTKMVGLAEIPR